jgi:hypothetical protein
MTAICVLVDMGISLFGPNHLFLWILSHSFSPASLGLIGGVCSVFHLVSVRRGGRTALSDFYPHLNRLRIYFTAVFGLVGLIIVGTLVGMFATSRGDGVQPVFALQDEYQLNGKATITLVSRSRYIAIGTCFTIGHRTMWLLFPLVSLHAALFKLWLHFPGEKPKTN